MEYFNDDETVFYDVYLSDYLIGLDDSFLGDITENQLRGGFVKSFTKEYVSTLKKTFSFGVPLNDVNDDAEIDFHTWK